MLGYEGVLMSEDNTTDTYYVGENGTHFCPPPCPYCNPPRCPCCGRPYPCPQPRPYPYPYPWTEEYPNTYWGSSWTITDDNTHTVMG